MILLGCSLAPGAKGSEKRGGTKCDLLIKDFCLSSFLCCLFSYVSLSPFPYVAHFSFNPYIAPLLPLTSLFLSSTSHLSYTTSLTSPPSRRHPPHPHPSQISPFLSSLAPSSNPITSTLESPTRLTASLSPLLFGQQPPTPHATTHPSCSPPPPRLWLLLPPTVSPRLLRLPCTGWSLGERSVVWLFSLFSPSAILQPWLEITESFIHQLPKG